MLTVCGVGLAVFSLAVLVPGGSGSAQDAETSNYLRALERICATGVTPEANRASEQVVHARDRQGQVEEVVRYNLTRGVLGTGQMETRRTTTPHGEAINFWGPQPPERAYARCFQAP